MLTRTRYSIHPKPYISLQHLGVAAIMLYDIAVRTACCVQESYALAVAFVFRSPRDFDCVHTYTQVLLQVDGAAFNSSHNY